jgi:hypothetical protein
MREKVVSECERCVEDKREKGQKSRDERLFLAKFPFSRRPWLVAILILLEFRVDVPVSHKYQQPAMSPAKGRRERSISLEQVG